MKANISVNSPEKIEATITLTFTLEQWKYIRESMKGMPFYGPSQQLRSATDELSEKLTDKIHFYEGDPE